MGDLAMDIEQATWLANLIEQAISVVEDGPGLTIELESDPRRWVQLVPEEHEAAAGQLAGFLINLPYRDWRGDPLHSLAQAGLNLPPDTRVLSWEDDGHATLWLRPDVPLTPLALLIGELFERFLGVDTEIDLTVQIEYGF